LANVFLPNICYVKQDILINKNSVLVSFDAPKLIVVEKSIKFGGTDSSYSNPLLSSISMEKLSTIGGNLVVGYNPKINSLSFPSLNYIGKIENSFPGPAVGTKILNNSALSSINMEELTTVLSSIVIQDNNELLSVTLPNLESVGFDKVPIIIDAGFQLMNNSKLTTFSVPVLSKSGRVLIENCGLTSIFMPELKLVTSDVVEVDIVYIKGNKSLFSVEFEKLETADIIIENNPLLETIDFPLHYSGAISIVKNNKMALFSLPTLNGGINVEYNDSLTSFSFPNLKSASSFNLGSNASLGSFSCPVLENITSDLYVGSSAFLTSFYLPALKNAGSIRFSSVYIKTVSLPELTEVSSYFDFDTTYSLTSISAPKLIKTEDFIIGGYDIGLECEEIRSDLTSITFSSLARVENNFYITCNEKLPTALATSLRDQVISRDGIGGDILITGNKP